MLEPCAKRGLFFFFLIRWPGEGSQAGERRLGSHGRLTSSVLYMPMPTPPAGKLYTSHSFALLPSFGVKTILNVPARSATKSVALYCKDERGAQARASRWGSQADGTQRLALAHLVAVGVPANGDGLGPARDEAGDVFAYDGLPEDGSAQDVPDGPIRTLPHLLQLEL